MERGWPEQRPEEIKADLRGRGRSGDDDKGSVSPSRRAKSPGTVSRAPGGGARASPTGDGEPGTGLGQRVTWSDVQTEEEL